MILDFLHDFFMFSRNSIPPTTTVKNFEEKLTSAEGNIFVDVGFWGGVVPGNTVGIKQILF